MSPWISNQHKCVTKREGMSHWWVHEITFAVLCVCEGNGGSGSNSSSSSRGGLGWGPALIFSGIPLLLEARTSGNQIWVAWGSLLLEYSPRISLCCHLWRLFRGSSVFKARNSQGVIHLPEKGDGERHAKKKSKKKNQMTAPGKPSQAWRDRRCSNINFLHVSDTEMKVKCRACHSGHKRYLPMNMDEKPRVRNSTVFTQKLIMIKKRKGCCNDCLMFSTFNDSPLQINKHF